MSVNMIKVLPDVMINRIAAGEVVENPASVVKELLENAYDAKATEVSVDIEHGGFSLLRVSDNGIGMSEEDVVLSVQRHATSKIACVEDLEALVTMGFRGEALASICAISNTTISSIHRDHDKGVCVVVKGGGSSKCFSCGSSSRDKC